MDQIEKKEVVEFLNKPIGPIIFLIFIIGSAVLAIPALAVLPRILVIPILTAIQIMLARKRLLSIGWITGLAFLYILQMLAIGENRFSGYIFVFLPVITFFLCVMPPYSKRKNPDNDFFSSSKPKLTK